MKGPHLIIFDLEFCHSAWCRSLFYHDINVWIHQTAEKLRLSLKDGLITEIAWKWNHRSELCKKYRIVEQCLCSTSLVPLWSAKLWMRSAHRTLSVCTSTSLNASIYQPVDDPDEYSSNCLTSPAKSWETQVFQVCPGVLRTCCRNTTLSKSRILLSSLCAVGKQSKRLCVPMFGFFPFYSFFIRLPLSWWKSSIE